MEVIHHRSPELPQIQMACDKVIDKRLLQYEPIAVAFSTPKATLLSGSMGAGKSTWILQHFSSIFMGCFHEIFLIIPENSFKSIPKKQNIFAKYLPPENIYHEYNAEVLKEIYAKLEDNSSNNEFSAIIIDDWGNRLKRQQESDILSSIILKNRHLRTSLFVLTQNYFQSPKSIREIMNSVILWNTNKSICEKFFMEQLALKPEQFHKLMKLCPTRHDYILFNGDTKRIFINGKDEVIFDD